MPEFTLRKTMLFVEEIHHDGGPVPPQPRRRAAIAVLVRNPFADGYVEDLQSAMDDLKSLGLMLTRRLTGAMGGLEGIDGYGKAAMAGENGELEHTALACSSELASCRNEVLQNHTCFGTLPGTVGL